MNVDKNNNELYEYLFIIKFSIALLFNYEICVVWLRLFRKNWKVVNKHKYFLCYYKNRCTLSEQVL